MTGELTPTDKAKFVAARQASEYVESGMKVGLGTGSTANWLIECLGEAVREEGLRIKGVATSRQTAILARECGIPLIDMEEAGWLDLTIDGADECDSDFNLIKGGGGALLREKIVAVASDRMIVIADASKQVANLGAFPLPVEVVPFGVPVTMRSIVEVMTGMDVMDRDANLRMDGDKPFVTDGGNYIIDLKLRRIGDPRQVGLVLNQVPGVVENGLFIDICDTIILGHADGKVIVRDLSGGKSDVVHFDVRDDDNIFVDIAD